MNQETFKTAIAAIERGLARCKPGEKPMDQALHVLGELTAADLKIVHRPGAWRKAKAQAEDKPGLCGFCNGTGKAHWPNTVCRACHGTGKLTAEQFKACQERTEAILKGEIQP